MAGHIVCRMCSMSAIFLVLTVTSAHAQSDAASSTGGNNVDSNNTDVDTTTTSKGKGAASCWLSAHDGFQEDLAFLLSRKVKLVELKIHLLEQPPDLLRDTLLHVYRPHLWVRSTSRQGRSLLMLDENYGPMSLRTLTIGVEQMTVNVSDHPKHCFRWLDEENMLAVLRTSLLRDFADPNDSSKGSLSSDEHICNNHILEDYGYAHFVYRCCHLNSAGEVKCQDITEDKWINVLLTLITIIKVLVVLYSPVFIPDRMYRLKYVAAQYLYRLPGPATPLKVVVTEDPDQFGPQAKEKKVRLDELKNMEVFKTMVATSRWRPDKIYEVKVKDIRLSVKARRLLNQNTVPVTIKSMLYNNLVRCRIRKLEPLVECCYGDILGRFNPGVKMVKWHQCMKVFAGMCTMILFATPWFIRMYGYFTFEADGRAEKERAASALDLHVKYPGNIVLYLSPIHGLFIFIYLIFIIDSMVYGVISKAMKEKLKHVVRDCLRDMRERSRIAIVAWLTKLIVLPFTMFGVLGFLLFIPYLVIVAIIGLPVAAFYVVPTLNLSLRLIINLFIFMCPNRVLARCKEFSQKFRPVRDHFNIHEVTANENFVKRHEYTPSGIALQLVVLVMVLISFWSLTLMLMEIVSFFVEVLVFTFMGIIVNAGTILQYVTVLFLLFLYSKNTFSTVTKIYQSYHTVIHHQLLALKKEEIDGVAKLDSAYQDNTAFVAQGEHASNMRKDVTPRIKIKEHQPQWVTHGMLVFLDKYDTAYTPEKFFFDTIDLKYFGSPGPIYRNVLAAWWEFLKIVLFLLFIFIVVMAFGDAYQVSTTNQLLATVVGGFVPFLFRYIFVSDTGVSGVDTGSIQFITEFHRAINNYTQSWGVFDIVPQSYKEWDDKDDNIDAALTDVDGNGNQTDAPNKDINNGTAGGSGGGGSPGGVDGVVVPSSPSGGGGSSPGGGVVGHDDDASFSPLLESSSFNDYDLGEAGGHVGSHRPGSTTVSMEESYPEVDIIVDVSTAKTRRLNPLVTRGFERGSVSMLDRSHSMRTTDSARESSRIYRPNERAIDV